MVPASGCAHCGLPLPRRPVRSTLDGRTEACCCYGCVIALAVSRARGEEGAASATLVRLGLAVFFTMNVMMVTMPTYAPALYGDAAGDGPLFALLRGLGVLLAAPVLLLLGGPVLAGALAGRAAGMSVDALVALGTFAAYGLSLASVIRGEREVYVDTACMLLVLVTLGRYLEARAKARAGAAVRATLAGGGAPVRRLEASGDRLVAAEDLRAGDRLAIRPGDVIPTDGVVEEGAGGVDESIVTGEPDPRLRVAGDDVAGGSCSIDGGFVVRVTHPYAESTAARIAALLRAALAERTASERLADRSAALLGPVAVAIALASGTWWAAEAGLGRGTMVALSVLVVACPCALGIAMPVAVWTALAGAAERGVIVRSAPVLERLARVRLVLFDKTGTLTTPSPRIDAIEPLGDPPLLPAEVLRLAAAVERHVPHPLARAVVQAARAAGLNPEGVTDVRVLPGRGAVARLGGTTVTVGTPRLAAESGVRLHDADDRWIWVLVDGRPAGRLRVGEAMEPTAAAAVGALRAGGMAVRLVTGAARADGVVPKIVAADEAACGLSPEGKVAAVRQLRERHAVAMVGDGLNDAPALAAADVGIAVGRATDLARIAADVVLLGGGLAELPWIVRQARRTVRVARQNLAWAFAYNAVALGLAAAGRLTPVVAALAMLASSATVLANARRLRARGREGYRVSAPPEARLATYSASA